MIDLLNVKPKIDATNRTPLEPNRWFPVARDQKTHAATIEFSGAKRVRESSCPPVTVSVTG